MSVLMGKKTIKGIIITLIPFFIWGCAETIPVPAEENFEFDEDNFNVASAERGGRLYDKWWAEKKLPPPTDINPVWQYRAKFPDSNSYYNNEGNGAQWRCKECHGWDYKGQSGDYSLGSDRYTGFNGLDNQNPLYTKEKIFSVISRGGVTANGVENVEHIFLAPGKLEEKDIYDLTKFIMDFARDGQGNFFGGDSASGKQIFDATDGSARLSCAFSTCHANNLAQIEEVANDNPQKFIHKVMFGNSTTPQMPGGLSISQARDVLKYVQDGTAGTPPTSNYNATIYAAQGESDVVKGGLLYDKWWKVTSTATEPATDHPKWAETNNTQVSGSNTWRCKECHGWDYRGRDGAYKNGTHFTGFAGIINTATASMTMLTADNVYSFLKTDTDHGFSNGYFTDDEYYDLTKFVMTMRTEAIANSSPYNFINDSTKEAINADVTNGKTLYEGAASCAAGACHGTDGKAIDFEDDNPAVAPNTFVNDVALDNPWEFVHKVRFGHPGSIMAGQYDKTASVKTIGAAIDILGHSQTGLVVDEKRAGLLYDKWWTTSGIKNPTQPTTRNPIWAAITEAEQDPAVLSNDSTWRCKECHGWDYLGKDGRYSDTTSKHYSGIAGFIPNSIVKSKAILVDAIANGNCTGCDPTGHSFSVYLSDDDINLLADFILNLSSSAEYNAALASSDTVNGKTLYDGDTPGNCLACHGVEGTSISGVDVAALANDNPQESLHKYRYGHPGSTMVPTPGGFSGLSLTEAGAVLAYAKTMANVTPPGENPTYTNASMNRGGRLYDKWWAEMQSDSGTVQAPVGINPFYQEGIDRGSLSTPVAGTENNTWRCKTCHAWNYKGVGYFPSEPDADNLIYKIDLRRTAFNNETDVQNHFYNWIKTGYGVTTHQFGITTVANPTPMTDKEIWDLVKFLLEGGLINTDTYILSSGIVIGTDTANGDGLYNGSVNASVNCSECHGIDGDTPPTAVQGGSGDPLDIFAIAAAEDNPWEFVHKTRFGQPNTPMPSTTGIPGLTDKDAYDILGYAQLRFNERQAIQTKSVGQ